MVLNYHYYYYYYYFQTIMGCASSKIEATPRVDLYRPAPTSFALFDINSIVEPWVVKPDPISNSDNNDEIETNKNSLDHDNNNNMPAPLLERLKTFEDSSDAAPHSWDEVSKALQDLNPSLHSSTSLASASPQIQHPTTTVSSTSPAAAAIPPKVKGMSFSFRTLEELENKTTTEKPVATAAPKFSSASQSLRKSSSSTFSRKPEFKNHDSRAPDENKSRRAVDTEYVKPVTENVFILRDRLERDKEGKEARFEKLRRDPLADFPDKCPPGGSDSVVLYTTSLRGVRRTFEDCNRVKTILEIHRVVFDERDVSLHAEFLNELKETLSGDQGEEEEKGMTMSLSVPRVFVKGRYIGGADEVVELNESGKLGKILNSARIERGVGRQACEGCGGARFVPCFDCGGSGKLVVGGSKEKERCPKCNENGLAHCPSCV